MRRFLYVCLLRLHPRHFRQRFAEEMLWIFDEAKTPGPLLADGVRSLARQWTLRSDAEEQPAPVSDGVPTFYMCGGSSPPRAALVNGALLALAVFGALALAIVHSGGRIAAGSWGGLGYGSPQYARLQRTPPSSTYDSLNPSLWSEVKEFFAGFVQSQPPPAPPAETPRVADVPMAPPQIGPQPPMSEADFQNAKLVLMRVVVGGDGRLAPAAASVDFLPSYASLVFKLDRDGDGRISKAERDQAFGDLLESADQNHDGFITREELNTEIRRRADANKDGIVTWVELENALRSGALKWPK